MVLDVGLNILAECLKGYNVGTLENTVSEHAIQLSVLTSNITDIKDSMKDIAKAISSQEVLLEKLTNIEQSIKKIGNEPEFNQPNSNENVILTTKVSSSTQEDTIYNVRLVDGLFNLKFTCDCGFQFGVGERTSCKHINSVFIKLLQAYKIGLPKSKKVDDEIIKMMKTLSF